MGRPQKKKPNAPKPSRCTRTTRSSFRRESSHPVPSSSQAASVSSSNSSDPGTLVMGQFLSHLKCHICTEFMTPPVRLCLRGHSTCGKCRTKMFHCGDCREPFSSDLTRNYLLEDILNSCSVQCQFQSAGCSQFIKLSDFATHTNSCAYNPEPSPPQIESRTGEGETLHQQSIEEDRPSYFSHTTFTNSNQPGLPIIESVGSYGSSSNISFMTSANRDAANSRHFDDYQRDPFATTISTSVDYATSPPTSLMEIDQVLAMIDYPPLISGTGDLEVWRDNRFQNSQRSRNVEALPSSGWNQIENRVINRAFRTSGYPLRVTEPILRGDHYTDSFSPPEPWPWFITGHGAAVASSSVNNVTRDTFSPEIPTVLDSSDLNESSMYGPRVPTTVTEEEALETGILLTDGSPEFEIYTQDETVPFFGVDNEELTRLAPLLIIDLVSSDEEE